MTSERIKEIQDGTAYPESTSVKQALLQVWNECEQEKSKKEIDIKKLRVEFFNECTLRESYLINDVVHHRNFLNKNPIDLFEWFKKKLTTKL